MTHKIRPLAIYLPQFHRIPENDKAWGEGFTEWTNVKKAKPLFEGHYQPHIPHESLGYYDLRDPEVMVKQAAMAKEYGIYGFAFYHYWFNGKRLLETPLDTMLKTGKPDLPFCYIWANENWTKRWDGKDEEIIIKQNYSEADDLEQIKFLCEKVFSDKRYIKVNGKPVFIIYRTENFPNIKHTARIWRKEVKRHGYKGIYLVRVESFKDNIPPKTINFDAAMEFSPDWNSLGEKIDSEIWCVDYATTIFNLLQKKRNYKLFRCAFPFWDNTPRQNTKGLVFTGTNPNIFKYFLRFIIKNTIKNVTNSEEQLVFFNAWNEWAEGCHLEPDEKHGYKYLEICKNEIELSKNYVQEKQNIVQIIYHKLRKILKLILHNRIIYKTNKK